MAGTDRMTPETSPLAPTARPLRAWLVLPAMWLPLAASFFYFVLFPGTDFGNAFYGGIKCFLLIWPFLAVALILREPMRDRRPGKRHREGFLLGTVFGLLVTGTMLFLVKATPLSALVDENGANIATRVEGMGFGGVSMADHYLLFALFISVLHAALEEYFWRWFVFGQLRQLMPLPAAYSLAAIGFASHHIVVLSQFFPLGWAIFLGLCVGAGGAAWSWIYQRTRSLPGIWFSHMIIDLGIMWIGWEVLR